MNTNTTHYAILEIAESASEEVVKAAYPSLSQKWHPDKNPANRDEAERRIRPINQAYAVLSDSSRRRVYDKQPRAARQADRQSAWRDEDAVGNKTSSRPNRPAQSFARQAWLGLLCGASVVIIVGVLPYQLATGHLGWEAAVGVLFWGAVGHYGYRGLRYPEADTRWRTAVARARRKALATALVACAASMLVTGAALVTSGAPVDRAVAAALEVTILVGGLTYIITALVHRAAIRS